MIWVVAVCGAMLAAGATMALIRVERGPSVLDRMVGLDIITSVFIIGLALEAAWSRRTTSLSILAALALVGFVASVTIARFASVEPEDAARIKTAEEARAEDEARVEREEADARREAEIAASRDDEAGSR
ncbi:MAG TPA: monovalent cation/H+ antiporter complex subunit F [Acidimicrobiia bacterium]|nr:monovalent cation/H+ antiporter complex subunit F [Acidimicrobiia bacterium]